MDGNWNGENNNETPKPLSATDWSKVGIFFLIILLFAGLTGEESTESSTQKNTERKSKVVASAPAGALKKDALICTSKSAFDSQIDYLSSGNMVLAAGCFIIPVAQKADLLEASWNGECKVRRRSDNKVLYTLCEDYAD